MKPMRYKNYIARIEYSDEDQCFVGHIAGINDVIGFHGENVKELHEAFEEAVDDYLATCDKMGRAPQKPCSGKFLLRSSPELHARAAMTAQAKGESLNSYVCGLIEKNI